jgi:hypothetical protein
MANQRLAAYGCKSGFPAPLHPKHSHNKGDEGPAVLRVLLLELLLVPAVVLQYSTVQTGTENQAR